jgi:hypothetical protein
MRNNPSQSRELRQLAAEFLQALADHEFLPDAERDDLAGSLVRQWLTYDRNAVLIIGERLMYLVLSKTPLGRWRVVPTNERMRWTQLSEDWKIDLDELPNIIKRLNLAQSAELTNLDGLPIRLWVDPKKRGRGVEPLVNRPLPSVLPKRDYHKIAGRALQAELGSTVAPDEMEALTRSVAAQWQQHEGHACIFLDKNRQLILTLTEQPDGGCNMTVRRQTVNLEPVFASLRLPTDAIWEAIVRFNLGEKVELRDVSGVASVLSHNPKTRRIEVGTGGPGSREQAI